MPHGHVMEERDDTPMEMKGNEILRSEALHQLRSAFSNIRNFILP